MLIRIDASVRAVRGGVQARSDLLELVGQGPDDESALTSLRRAVEAWCSGLAAAKGLDEALDRRGIVADPAGDLITVQVTRNPTIHAV